MIKKTQKIITGIGKRIISFSWPESLLFMKRNSVSIVYDVNVSKTPRHLVNFMFGLLMSEFFSWNNYDFEFDELTEKELQCINDHIKLNHISNSYGRVMHDRPSIVTARNIVEEDSIINNGTVMCANGLGKDGIGLACMIKEIGLPIRCFTVGIQYNTEGQWHARINTANKFYDSKHIDSNIIITDFLVNRCMSRQWLIFAIPLAYYYGSNIILTGLCFGTNKLWKENLIPTRLNTSIFSFDYRSKVSGITFASPTWALSNLQAQQLLIERYPESVQYQRSCMFGFRHCNKCPQCMAISLYIKVLGYDHIKFRLPTVEPKNIVFQHVDFESYDNAYKKWKGQPYDNTIEQMNTYALNLSWDHQDKIKSILREHFDEYASDPVSGVSRTTYMPSKWKYWMNDGFNEFWKK